MNQTMFLEGVHRSPMLHIWNKVNLPSGMLAIKGNSILVPHLMSLEGEKLKQEFRLLPKRVKIHGWKDITSMKLEVFINEKRKNKVIEAISSALSRHFINLEQLEVSFEGPHLEDWALIDFGYKISRNLNKLQNLRVAVSSSHITDDGVRRFAYEIGRYLTNLKELRVLFESCTGLSEAGIIALTSKISRQMPNLEKLELALSWSAQISDSTVKRIQEEICSHMKKLTSLTLDLRRCPNIGVLSLQLLAEHLPKKLQNLTTLKLKFGSPWISDLGIINFGKLLFPNLNTIKHLEIRFWRCQGLTDEGVLEFADLVKDLTNLEHLLIDLFECQNISLKAKKTLEKSMSHLPKSIFIS